MVAPIAHTALTAPTSTPPASRTPRTDSWLNPAAAAALRSNVELLHTIEDGIVKNFTDVGRASAFAADLTATSDIFSAARDAVANDKSVENDQFLPLIDRAENGVGIAANRLTDKDLAANWPIERGDILSTIRAARVLSDNVARQLDPLTTPS